MRSALAAVALSFGEKMMYRDKFVAFRTVETCVADDALPVSAPESVVAVTPPTLKMLVEGVYKSALAVWMSVAAPTELLLGTNVMYRAVTDALFVAVTRVAVDALPVSAPVNVVDVTAGTLRMPVDGVNESDVTVWMSAGLPPAVLSFGVTHKYRATVAELILLVTTCDASVANPIKLGAVIDTVEIILGTLIVPPPDSPGVYVSPTDVRTLLVALPFASENVTY